VERICPRARVDVLASRRLSIARHRASLSNREVPHPFAVARFDCRVTLLHACRTIPNDGEAPGPETILGHEAKDQPTESSRLSGRVCGRWLRYPTRGESVAGRRPVGRVCEHRSSLRRLRHDGRLPSIYCARPSLGSRGSKRLGRGSADRVRPGRNVVVDLASCDGLCVARGRRGAAVRRRGWSAPARPAGTRRC